MKKNEETIGIVTALGMNGEGIVKQDGIPVFIPFALEGETVSYRIVKVKKSFAFGKLLSVLSSSALRVNPVCPVFGKCGGCQLQHMEYAAQLEYKRHYVEDCFRKIAFLEPSVEQVVPSSPYRYRNKLQLPAGENASFGFFAINSHRVVPIFDCPIQPTWAKEIIRIMTEYVRECGVSAYDEERRTGFLRHIVVRDGMGKMIVTVVGTDCVLPWQERLIQKLSAAFPTVTLYLNVNRAATNVVFGERFILLYGEARYRLNLCGVECEFGAESFMQVNFEVAEKLYTTVVSAAAPNNDTTVIDAYSGAGLMTALLASRAKRAIGIECVKEAVECADRVAAINGLEGKMENICGNCEDFLPDLVKRLKSSGEHVSVVLDPPRKGCDRAVLEAIISAEIEHIVYVSCNPATLARDVGILSGTLYYDDSGLLKKADFEQLRYDVIFVNPFDMFPQTANVETVVVLSRKKTDGHIGVTV